MTKAEPSATKSNAVGALGLVPLLVVLGTVLLAISLQRLFWCDELLLISLIEAVPAPGLLDALRKGADGGFPLPYFVFAAWSVVAGSGELLWRMPSVLAGLLTAVAVYVGSRTFVAKDSALFCTIVATFGSTMFLRHAAEVRFYSFYYMGAALMWMALAALFRVNIEQSRSKTAGLGLILLLGNAVLVLSHQFGFLYSAILFGTWTLFSSRNSVSRFHFAGICCMPGWMLFLGLLPLGLEQKENLIGAAQIYGRPPLLDLIKVYLQLLPGFSYEAMSESGLLVTASVILTLLSWVFIVTSAVGAVRAPFDRRELPVGAWYVLCTAMILLSVPAVFWVLAQMGFSFLLYRYLFPTQLGFVLLLLFCVSILNNNPQSPRIYRVIGAAVIAWSLIGLLGVNRGTATFARDAKSAIPVVSFSLAEFYAALRYSPQLDFYYLLDDQVAHIHAQTFQHALSEQAIQRARRDLGIIRNIVTRDELKAVGSEFKISALNQCTIDYFKNVSLHGFEVIHCDDGSLTLRRKTASGP